MVKTKLIRVPLSLYNFLNLINSPNEPLYDVIRRLLHFKMDNIVLMDEKEFINHCKVISNEFDYKKYTAINSFNEEDFQLHSNHLTTHTLRKNSISMNSIFSHNEEMQQLSNDGKNQLCSWFIEADFGVIILVITKEGKEIESSNKYYILDCNEDFRNFFK